MANIATFFGLYSCGFLRILPVNSSGKYLRETWIFSRLSRLDTHVTMQNIIEVIFFDLQSGSFLELCYQELFGYQ
jgi:hypothetical protein